MTVPAIQPQPADDTDVAPTDELLPWPTQAFQLVKPLGQDVVMAFPVPLETTLPPTRDGDHNLAQSSVEWNTAMIKPGVAGWVSDHSADWDTPPMLTVTVARDANCAVKKSLPCMTSAGANSTCNCSAVLPEVPPELRGSGPRKHAKLGITQARGLPAR